MVPQVKETLQPPQSGRGLLGAALSVMATVNLRRVLLGSPTTAGATAPGVARVSGQLPLPLQAARCGEAGGSAAAAALAKGAHHPQASWRKDFAQLLKRPVRTGRMLMVPTASLRAPVLQILNSRGGDEDREGKQEVFCLARVGSSRVWPEGYGE